MAAVQKVLIYSGSLTGNYTDGSVSLEGLQTDFVGFLDVSAIGVGATVTVKIERSPNGTDYFDWITFSSAGTVQKQIKDATAPGLSYARMSATFVGGTTTATIAVSLHYDKKSK